MLNRNVYGNIRGSTRLPLSGAAAVNIAEKTWVAPPLAVKHQTAFQTQARGYLIVTTDLASHRIQVVPYWYDSPNPPTGQQIPSKCDSLGE